MTQLDGSRRGLRNTANFYARDCSDDDDFDGNLQEALETLEMPIQAGPGRYDKKREPLSISAPTPEQAEVMDQSTLLLFIFVGTLSLMTG